MAGNYIKIDRKMLKWEWYENINTKVLFLHCLLKANWKDGKFEGRVIKRGSFVTSLPKLAEETGLTVRQARVAIDHLVLTGELTVETNNRYRIITVNNYSQYQDVDRQDDSQMTDKRQANDRQVTAIEEYKESKEVNKRDIYIKQPSVVVNVINYLNKKCNTKYKPTSKDTIRHINARLEEGYKEEDFYKVIDNKVADWKDTEQEKYLRPETLFGTKFEGYLNQKINKDVSQSSYLDAIKNRVRMVDDF